MTHFRSAHVGRRRRGARLNEAVADKTGDELLRQARLIDLAPAATIVRDMNGTIRFWSAGAERLYGWTRAEAIGRRTHDLLQTRFPTSLEDILAAVREGGKWSGELRHVARDGREVIVESHWMAQLGNTGEIEELLESNADITERKRAEELLRDHAGRLGEEVAERTAELRRANAELESFCYSLSNDMRGPLRSIRSFTEFVLEDCGKELSGTAKDYLGRVTGAARRLDRLIQDVLALSQVSRAPMELKPIEVEKLVREIVAER